MHGHQAFIMGILQELKVSLLGGITAECVIFPPAIYLSLVQMQLQGSVVRWGGQNVYPALQGAYTGEISSSMLKEYGCTYVLVGHSERRTLFKEDEKFIAEKFHHVKDHGMIPILCVGETWQDRQEGRTEAVITQQLNHVALEKKQAFQNAIIAYEPVWAIGTGETATPEEAQVVHAMIRKLTAGFNKEDAEKLPILYGGSVNEKNARSLFAMPDIDGGLVGGASLSAKQFVEIVKCIN